MRNSSSTFYKSTRIHCADSLSYPIVFRVYKFISSWKWHWKRGLGTREYNGKIARLLPSWNFGWHLRGKLPRMKIHFQLAVFVIVIALLWGVEDFVRLCEGPSSKQKKYGSFDYQQCAGNAEQTLVGNGRNWKAEKSKILKLAVLKLPHVAFVQVCIFD